MSPNPTQPWYRHRIAWLVVALPLIAVVASFITLFVALSNPDPVLPPAARRTTQQAAEETSFCRASGWRTVIWRCRTSRMPSSWNFEKVRLTVSSFRPR